MLRALKVLTISIFFLSSTITFASNLILFDKPIKEYRIKNYEGENKISRFKSLDDEVIITHKSNSSASGLFYDININLRKQGYRYLNFEWKVEKFKNTDEKKKKFHDFPARVYLTYKDGMMPWNKYFINYVFSNTNLKNTHWKSPYNNLFTKSYDVALNGYHDPGFYWIKHKVDLRNDIQKFWNIDIDYLESIALMVDTDNTKTKTETSFKNIYLSKN